LQNTAEAVTVGPILVGTRLPAHLLQYGAKVHDLVNLTAVGVVEATSTPPAD
jgi:malate dehydrogenase (oxaloacetate-decarboxylating)(NADP+)